MKTLKKILLPILIGISLLLVACDEEIGSSSDSRPTKVGGGGQQQHYNPENGRY